MSSGLKRVTIVGLGLIGGSLGLALKAGPGPEVEVIGYDRNRTVAAKARRLGAIDRAGADLAEAVAASPLVVIATPILAIRQTLERIAPHLQPDAVVTDTGSTKAMVMAWAGELLPPGVSFVGGHPMAGKETQGVDHAQADLFHGKTYCLCPSPGARQEAVDLVTEMVRRVGGQPLLISAAEHDRYVAAVSHLPLVVSVALFNLVRSSPDWPRLATLAASGFRDVTRLASGDPEMGHDICVTNREQLLHWLDRFQEELARFRELILRGGRDLYDALAMAQAERNAFLGTRGAPSGRPPRPAGRRPRASSPPRPLAGARRQPGRRRRPPSAR